MTGHLDRLTELERTVADLEQRLRDCAAQRDEALALQAANSEVLNLINARPDELDPVFELIVKKAMRFCDASGGGLWIVEGDHARAVGGSTTLPKAFIDYAMAAPLPVSVLLGRNPGERPFVHIEDLRATRGYREREPFAVASVELGKTIASLCVPLAEDGVVRGVFTLARDEARAFTDRQIALAQTFAAQALIALKNARLFNDAREALEQQTATANVLKVISRSASDAAPVFEAILESCQRQFALEAVAVYIVEGDSVRGVAKRGWGYGDWGSDVTPLAGSSTGLAIAERRAVHFPDLADKPDMPEKFKILLREGGGMSVLYAPMLCEDHGVGSIVVSRKPARPFTEKEIAQIQTFADQAVIAIENTRLFDEVQSRTRELTEALQQQTATADVLKVISRSVFDLDTVTTTILQSAMELCHAPTGLLHLRDGDVFKLKLSLGHTKELDEWNSQYPIPLKDALHRRGPVHPGDYGHYEDMWNDPEYRFKKAVKMGGVRSGVVMPMFREEEVIGLFSLARFEPGPFSPSQIKLGQTFADQAAIAIENVRLFNEVRTKTDDLAEALRMQTATSDVLKVISRSAFDLQAVFNTLVTSAVQLGGAMTGTICVRDGDVYRYRDTVGAEHTSALAQYLRSHPAVPGRATIAGRVLLSGKVERIPDCLADPEYVVPMGALTSNVRSLLGVPLLRKDGVEGAIILTRAEPGDFTERQIEIVQTFADQAVIALENIRLFDEVQARTKELAASLDDLRKAQDRLVQSEKLASLGQLTAGIAHEIKNPLNFVNNFSALSRELLDELIEVLGTEPFGKAQREEAEDLIGTVASNLDKVVQHGKRADSIVKNMLLHSREGSGEIAEVNINAMVEEALNLAYHGARAERPGFNVTIRKSLDPEAGAAQIFAQDMTRVLLNLISNGFYATNKRKQREANGGYEPTLIASTRGHEDRVEIAIRDNGTGIPDEALAKIFNPFFTTKPAGEGTGLGLSLSHDIVVKQHGGTLDVATELGAFTEFKLVVPRASSMREPGRGSS